MPTGKNWINFIYINIIFIVQIAMIYYLISMKKVMGNWPLYRCNPMYMMFSKNIQQDFVYCVQNIQSKFMGYLLQPLTYTTTLLASLGGDLTGNVNDVRSMFNKVRISIASVLQNIFGVFLNLVIEFEKTTLKIKDIIGRMTGTMTTLVYLTEGSVQTMKSNISAPRPPPPCILTDAEAQCYLDRYPDLQRAFGRYNIAAAKKHYCEFGQREGRNYSCNRP